MDIWESLAGQSAWSPFFFVIHPLHLNIDLAAIVSPLILQNQLALFTFCVVGALDDR